jgi:hypothetical protein
MASRIPDPSLLSDLERRYDGPIPARLVSLALDPPGTEAARRTRGHAEAQARAADCRLGIGRRRRKLRGDRAAGDAWLARLAAGLADARHRAARLFPAPPPG